MTTTWVRPLPDGTPDACPRCGGRLTGAVRSRGYHPRVSLVIWCRRCERTGVSHAWRHFREGRVWGYPLCCRLHFALDRLLGRLSATLRSEYGDGYAPCAWHSRRRRR